MNHRVRAAGPFEYFCRKVRLGRPDECWEWQGSLSSNGYGNWSAPGQKKGTAHRATYKLFHGEIPAGYYVCHRCNNPKCCNPDHLYTGTPKDNHDHMVRVGNRARTNPGKLPDDLIRDIRRLRKEGIPGNLLAKRYDISQNTICDIHKRRTYWYVED